MRLLLGLVLPLFFLDQISKMIIEKNVAYGEEIPVIDNFFWINHVHNKGMAFGIGHGSAYANLIFGLIAVGAIIFLVFYILWDKKFFTSNCITISFIIAGILGNLTDRIFRGHVVDFLHFNLGFMHWPSFNVADACICCGAISLAILSFYEEKRLSNESL